MSSFFSLPLSLYISISEPIGNRQSAIMIRLIGALTSSHY